MLESAEIGHKISKKTYARKEPQLREALLNASIRSVPDPRGPVLIILSGVQAGGRGETANKLTEWMDPRHIRVVAFGPRTPEEAERPPAWRVLAGASAQGQDRHLSQRLVQRGNERGNERGNARRPSTRVRAPRSTTTACTRMSSRSASTSRC